MRDVTCIPTELWRLIVPRACTDGGFTGRSLTLTSKFIHAQSASGRFHSLAFTSLERVEGFLAFLRLQPEDFRLMVEHLYLSFVQPKPARPIKTLSADEYQALCEKVKAERQIWHENLLEAVSALLKLVSPTLRTFTLLANNFAAPLRLPSLTLPNLQELSFLGDPSLFFSIGGTHRKKEDVSFSFPALQRLHYIPLSQSDIGPLVDALARDGPPVLTHLRFSNVIAPFPLNTDLCGLLGVQYISAQTTLPAAETKLSRLQHVVLHVVFHMPSVSTSSLFLEDLARQSQAEKGIRMVVVERNGRWDWHRRDRLRNDWLARVEGRQGCWVNSMEEEAALEVPV